MTGPYDSVLGADKEIVIKRFLTQKLLRMESAKGLEVEVNAVFLDIDDQTGLAQNIARIRKIVALD
jgi:calcineurin-like phosphoesterase